MDTTTCDVSLLDRRHWGRSSDRHRDRGRDNRGRDWDRERKYDRGYKSRDRHDRASSPSRDKNVFVKGMKCATFSLILLDKSKRIYPGASCCKHGYH